MNELPFEPYAVVQRWTRPEDGSFEDCLSEYLESLAQACRQAGAVITGHIKALAVFPSGGFLRISVVDPDLPANRQGSVPSGTDQVSLTLNVLVYGLHAGQVRTITRDTAHRLAARRRCEVSFEEPPVSNPIHPHDHSKPVE
jgi:hypothetical protein